MLDILCENYPHLMDRILKKMPYTSITGVRDISPELQQFVTRRNFNMFVSIFNLKESNPRIDDDIPYGDHEEYDPVLRKSWGPDDDNLSEDVQINNQITNVYVEKFFIRTEETDHEALTFIKSLGVRFSCLSLTLHVQDDNTAFEYIELLHPEEVVLNDRYDYNSKFLQNPALKYVSDIYVNVPGKTDLDLKRTRIRLSLSGLNLRKFEFDNKYFFENEIINFVQRFLQGKQVIRRLQYRSNIDPHFRNKFIATFANNIKECYYGFLHLFSANEDAFVLIEEHRFFFRCVKRINAHILVPYFQMRPDFYRSRLDDEFKLPEIDQFYESYFHDELEEAEENTASASDIGTSTSSA